MKIKTIIVDDQHDARQGLELLLSSQTDFELVGQAKNGLEALDLVRSKKPDLIFLDIQMPGIDGFEVLNSIEREQLPDVIFTTAFDEFAIKAFEVSAIDYLLKPYSDQRFEEALEKAKLEYDNRALRMANNKVKSLLKYYQNHGVSTDTVIEEDSRTNRFVIKENGRIKIIEFDSVIWVEAFDYYSKLHTASSTHLIRKSMKKIEEELPDTFLRIHRSFIVRADQIQEIRKEHYAGSLVLKNGNGLAVSAKYWKQLKTYFPG